MRFRTHYRLFLSYSLLVAAVVLVLTVGVEATLRPQLLEQAESELARELGLGRELYDRVPAADSDSMARFLGTVTGHRVTIIAADGTVLGDSGVDPEAVPLLENHAGRPEFRDAFQYGSATTVRHSTSVAEDMLYAATTTNRGDVLRFAIGIEQVDAAVAAVRLRILQVGALALLLAALFSLAFSHAVTRPLRRMQGIARAMAGGDLTARVQSSRRDELGELGNALDTLSAELRRRLDQLEAEREEMRALIDSMAEGVLAIGPDGSLRRTNPAARRMFGLGADTEGAPPEAIARRKPYLDLVRDVLTGVPVPATELTYDGKHLLATAQPLPGGGAVLVFLDTSELRRLEGVRRDFVANASHELKTPFTAIRGYSETLLDESLPEAVRRKFTETLHGNVVRLHDVIDDLLDLSTIESGGWTMRPESVTVEQIASESWHSFAVMAEERDVAFGVEIEPGCERVTVDPGALRQIFSNLFSNSLRYTPPGGRIDVRVRRADPPAIHVEVCDTGSGIPAAHLGRIFERFYRVDPARSRAQGGTGLGLAIVRHLVERHGGRVEAESRIGHGTTIRIVLPET